MTTLARRLTSFSAVLFLGASLAACSPASDQGSGDATRSPSTNPSATSTSSASTGAASSAPADDDRAGTPIRITIGDQTLDATVWDTPAGRDLLSQLPVTLHFEDLNNAEKIGHLEHPLTMDGMPKGDDPQVGDLGWYAPWGNVVLYYGDVGYWDGIARIGRIHGDLSIISDQTGDFTATLKAAG